VTDRPYTDDDLRAEAACQFATLTEDPEFMCVGEGMEDSIVASTEPEGGRTWGELLPYKADGGEAYNAAQRKIHALINGAADVSEWAVNLGADGLTETTSLIWTCAGSGRDLAVQIAHRPGIKPEMHDEIESAVCRAVERVLDERGLNPRLEQI
jgi:hypothetical protein